MEAKEILSFLQKEIHTTVAATIDPNGKPVTCAIDMMDCDDNSLYFLTAKGKSFYDRLTAAGYMALTGLKGEATMSCVAVSIRGRVRELGRELLPRLFAKNAYMHDIYPTAESRGVLTVFQLYEGAGEWFDLSKSPIERADFVFGGAEHIEDGYFVTDTCIGCKLCESQCPQRAIDISVKPVVIRQAHCIRCGNCFAICPAGAILKRR